MFCSKCGFEMPDTSLFCSKCGVKTTSEVTSEIITSAKKSKIEEVFYLLGTKYRIQVVMIAILIFAFIMNFRDISSSNKPLEVVIANQKEKEAAALKELQRYEEEAKAKKQQANDDVSNLIIVYEIDGTILYKPNQAACKKAKQLNQQYTMAIANQMHVSTDSISLETTENRAGHPEEDCDVIVNTPQGLKKCTPGSVVKSDKGTLVITPIRVMTDGTLFNIGSACINY